MARSDSTSAAEKANALHITNQFRRSFREGGAMVYDLKCEGVRLTLQVSAKNAAADPDEWRIEARAARPSAGDRSATVIEWGTTRAAALRAVGSAWGETDDTRELRVFDWDKVAQALESVRAI